MICCWKKCLFILFVPHSFSYSLRLDYVGKTWMCSRLNAWLIVSLFLWLRIFDFIFLLILLLIVNLLSFTWVIQSNKNAWLIDWLICKKVGSTVVRYKALIFINNKALHVLQWILHDVLLSAERFQKTWRIIRFHHNIDWQAICSCWAAKQYI